ncbi:restriction endonuclease subunit S [Halorubrum rutilum]|uniref:Restriction endonuclease subunit S n=1 Tax=Halorubrum rutilum TaxID=1364933 RepID=A0ABD6AGN2_9EURY|nr:restriction endonuclease subunit S [Halorubrum rutilum]
MSEEAKLDDFKDHREQANEWAEKSLVDLCEIGGGSTPKKSNDEYWDGGKILWTTPKDFDAPRLNDTEDKMTKKGVEASTSKIYSSGTTLMVVRSGVLRHTLPVAMVDNQTTINQDLKALDPDNEQVNAEYFFQAISGLSEDIRGSCKKTGTTVESIQTNVLKQYQLPVPSKSEQQKIATVLHNVDQAIQKTGEIVEQANRLKKSFIQEFFSRGYYDHQEWHQVDMQDAYVMTRTETLPAAWDIKKSGKITEVKTGHTPSTSVDEYWDGEISWVDIHDLTQLEGTVIHTTDDTITKEGLNNSGAKLLPEGTLVLCRTGAIGETAILGKEMATDQDQVTFECDKSEVLPRYLMYLFEYATPQLERLSAGSTHNKVQLHFFSNLEIPLPEIDEQRKIIEVIESVDEVSQANKKQLDNLHQVKQGLVQDLLSGTVRTTNTNIEVPEEIEQHG